MDLKEIRIKIDNYRDSLGRLHDSVIKKKDPELIELRDKYLTENFNILKDQVLNTKNSIKWVIFYNQYTEEEILCPVCKKNLINFWKGKKGSFCSEKCRKAGGEFIKEKLIKTNKEKYGTVSTAQVKENRDKQVKTKLIKKYGEEKANILLNKDEIIKRFKRNELNEIDIEKFENFFNMERQIARKWLNKHGLSWARGRTTKSENIFFEKNLKEIAKNEIIEKNIRTIIKPYEIDFYFPKYKTGIELNGLYWHSYGNNNVAFKQSDKNFQKTRHLDKFKLAIKNNISLFQIFENEVYTKYLNKIWKFKIYKTLEKFEKNDLLKSFDKIILINNNSSKNLKSLTRKFVKMNYFNFDYQTFFEDFEYLTFWKNKKIIAALVIKNNIIFDLIEKIEYNFFYSVEKIIEILKFTRKEIDFSFVKLNNRFWANIIKEINPSEFEEPEIFYVYIKYPFKYYSKKEMDLKIDDLISYLKNHSELLKEGEIDELKKINKNSDKNSKYQVMLKLGLLRVLSDAGWFKWKNI